MKEAVCIDGSPNSRTSAASLLSKFARGMAGAGIGVRAYRLGDMDIGYCRGCRACVGTGACARQDDMDTLMRAVERADIVCVGSPDCWGGISAQLKAFFERSLALRHARQGDAPAQAGKAGISAAIAASPGETMRLIETIECWFGRMGIRPAGQLHFEGAGPAADIGDEALKAAYAAGRAVEEYGNPRKTAYSLAVAAESDAGVIAGLQAELFKEESRAVPEPPGNPARNIKRLLAGEYCGILAWVRGKVAGYFLYRPVARPGKDELRLEQYYIRPEYRYMGLPAAALRRIVDVCFRDAQCVGLDILESWPVGRAFWADSGCKPEYVRFFKKVPVFSDENPLQIIGWEQRQAEMSGRRSFIRKSF